MCVCVCESKKETQLREATPVRVEEQREGCSCEAGEEEQRRGKVTFSSKSF